jgi:Phage major capsid protein E
VVATLPDISLLEPVVLRGVVEKLQTPETLIMKNRIPSGPWPYPVARWDVIRGSRAVARPNVPNSEAHIVPRLGRSQESASFIYLREKKIFEPTTLHWLREPGQLAAINAEKAVLREINDLNIRFDNFVEFCSWQALKGRIVLDYTDVQADIDYKFTTAHKPTASTLWTTATVPQIISDIRAWKRLIQRDGQVPVREAFATENTLALIFEAFARDNNAAGLMSDRMRDEYYSSGMLPGFLGMNWIAVESIYETDDGTQTRFLEEGTLILANMEDNRPIEFLEGPTADDDAPQGHTGKFSKTWKEEDPSHRQYLLEYSFLPIITRPEQFVVASVGVHP